ncbi:MAG: DUF2723 domain-containing protein, partial [Anaerolineae bacterium]|nr:DUF2723 domain-containing protein [Anaerolineae bacterium]
IWGTIHHTGYPLFAILGNVFTAPLRLTGLEPATAASLYAMAWGAVTLIGAGPLIWRLTERRWLAVLALLPLGLARSIWIHHVVAEVYSMSLALIVLLLLVALWALPGASKRNVRRRVFLLALIGGVGVAHHRAVAFIAPGLLLALWPDLIAYRDYWRKWALLATGIFLLGFVPYIYLPLRAWQDAAWVYGEPGTLRGLWIEFSGKEADRLVTLPTSFVGLWDNVSSVWDILVHELTLPGVLLGLIGLGVACTVLPFTPQRRAARIIALSAAGPTLFAIFFHTAVLPQAILMPTVLALILGVALALDWLAERLPHAALGAGVLLVVWGGALAWWSYDYIDTLVTEPSGLDAIDHMANIPRNEPAAYMLPWGPRYAAASYATLVEGDYPDIRVVDHKANYAALLTEGYRLYTEPKTFYTYPPPWQTAFSAPSDWWTTHLGPLYLTSAAPGIVELHNTPWLNHSGDATGTPILDGIERRAAWLTCDADHIYLHVQWGANTRPDHDPSIFVHLTPDEPIPNPPNADQRHPVYGLYPFVEWSPGQLVRDDFTLPRQPDKTQVRFGLYEQDANGQFVNYGELVLPVADCLPAPER